VLTDKGLDLLVLNRALGPGDMSTRHHRIPSQRNPCSPFVLTNEGLDLLVFDGALGAGGIGYIVT